MRGIRSAKGAEDRDAEGVQGVGNGEGVPPSPADYGERSKLPQRGPGQSPGEKRFYCFLSVSERLSLQRFLKISVVHSRPLVLRKKLVSSMGRF